MSAFKLAITCGGTGGHFHPGLTIAREVKTNGDAVLVILSGKEADAQAKIVEGFGLDYVIVPSAPLTKNPFRFMMAGLQQLHGAYLVRKAFKSFKPNAVLAMGSFTSFPAVMAAIELKIPLFLHDGNARIGKANRFFSKHAKMLMTAFPAVNANACKCRVECVGLPIRPELENAPPVSRAEAIARVNAEFSGSLDPTLPTLLVFGGSLGARSINHGVCDILNSSDARFQVIHLTGKGQLREGMYTNHPSVCMESTGKMDLLYHAADHVISRAGGSTLTELALFAKDALVIPYPFASEDHQTDNARYFADANALQVLVDKDIASDTILPVLERWLQDPAASDARCAAIRKLARPYAAQFIAAIIRKAVK